MSAQSEPHPVRHQQFVLNDLILPDPEEEASRPQDAYEPNTMASHYYDPEWNFYADGPGSRLADQFLPAAMAKKSNEINRETCGVYLNYIPLDLTDLAMENLCKRFGKVVNVSVIRKDNRRGYNFGFVDFATSE